MTSTHSHPSEASLTLPDPINVAATQENVHPIILYLVAPGSAKEAAALAGGTNPVVGSLSSGDLYSLTGGNLIDSITITAFDADSNLDGATGEYVFVMFAGNTGVYVPTGMSVSWSVVEALGELELSDVVQVSVAGEAHAIIQATVRN